MTQFRKEDMVNISIDFNLISELKHPSILLFVGFSPFSFKNEPNPVIVTKLSSSKTLTDILKMERKNLQIPDWDETKKLINIYEIASSMKYLHANGIINRNLKPNNIIMNESVQPKLSDFGLCTYLLMMNSIAIQTTSRMETIITQECTKASDVYSFSMIVYEIVTKEKPIVNSNIYDGILNLNEKKQNINHQFQIFIKI